MLLVALCLVCGASAQAADLRVAGIFADDMVLQCGVKVPVWGWGSPGSEVNVEFAGQRQDAMVGDDGKWSLNLAPQKASSNGSELKVSSGKEVIVFKDVLVGEVWLCSGQSNMQRNLTEADNAMETVAKADFPTIRFVIVPHYRSPVKLDEFNKLPGSWHPVAKADGDYWKVSAVAFFFAKSLQQKLGVPVGLIISAWEGSVIQTWIPKDDIPDSLSDIKKATGRNAVALTFNAKINPMIPDAIRGVIWYQGEDNHDMGMKYSDYLTCMAKAWRKEWGSDLPFLIVMLAPHTYEGVPVKFPAEKGCLPPFWMAQLDAARRLKNTEVACTIDVGSTQDNIHPRQKEPVGKRLAMAGMKLCYGANDSAPGPLFKSVDFNGKTATVTFENIAQGLKLNGDPNGFEIAGTDKKYVPAKTTLRGKDTVILQSDAVAQPAFVRYAWSNTPGWSLYNSEGLPALPFSTEWNASQGPRADN